MSGPGINRRVAIVGAGPGGLAAAMLAAQAGAEVTVFERHAEVGGRSGSIHARSPSGGFHFDVGPTFFLYPTLLAEIFSTCGYRLEDHVELIRLATHYDLKFEDGPSLRIPSDLAGLQREIARISPGDAANVPRFVEENRRKFEKFKVVLGQEFSGPRSLVSAGMLRALPMLRPLSTVDRDLARHFADPRVRLAFSFQSKYLGMSPYRCPSLFTILAFMEHEFGIYHPRGGTGAVMRAMADVARMMGVRFRLGEPVRALEIEGRRAVGVRTDAGLSRADAVVINADFARSMTKLVPDAKRKRWTDRKLAAKKYSCSAFMLYLGIEGPLDGIAHHTIFLSDDFRTNFLEIEDAKAPPRTPSFYMQNACVTDAALAPPGHSTLYVLIPVGNRLESGGIVWDEALRAKFRAVAMQRLAKAGLPDLETRIRYERMVTPDEWEQDFDVHKGAVFNLAHNIGQMLHWRPHNRFEELDGVYIVGGGTHPGSGLPVIFEGARISMRLLADDLGLKSQDSLMPVRHEPVFEEVG